MKLDRNPHARSTEHFQHDALPRLSSTAPPSFEYWYSFHTSRLWQPPDSFP